MINRIVVIGNGFDLAHGLKTSYRDFFAGYWDFIKDELIHSIDRHNSKYEIKDKLCTISLNDHTFPWYVYLTHNGYAGVFQLNGMDFYNKLRNDHNVEITYSYFFERIRRSVVTKNWVDIENEYYKLLKDIAINESYYSNLNIDINKLNEELEYIKYRLIEYLKRNMECDMKGILLSEMISPLEKKDMSIRGKQLWNQFRKERKQWTDNDWNLFFIRYYKSFNYKNTLDKHHFNNELIQFKTSFYEENRSYSYVLRPDNILFLDFNYTNTIDRYLNKNSIFKHIHIHGSVSDIQNVILGYGDELDKDFKTIEDLNENEYLKNVKSTNYLNTDNYNTLLSFINSSPYQVITMGHSCGNSDRTLLNTLFEHENCISIKPYYYEHVDDKGNITDNYTDLVQNIYRNFTNKADVRDKLVNKTFCSPMIPVVKE